MKNQTLNIRSQRGAILIFALILLTILTLVGVSANRDIILQERMTGNELDYSVSLQAAEAALRDAEAFIGACAPRETIFDGEGLYRIDAIQGTAAEAPDWRDAIEYPIGDTSWVGSNLTQVSADPRYMAIRHSPVAINTNQALDVTEVPQSAVPFKMVAQGFGTSTDTITVLEAFHYAYNCER